MRDEDSHKPTPRLIAAGLLALIMLAVAEPDIPSTSFNWLRLWMPIRWIGVYICWWQWPLICQWLGQLLNLDQYHIAVMAGMRRSLAVVLVLDVMVSLAVV